MRGRGTRSSDFQVRGRLGRDLGAQVEGRAQRHLADEQHRQEGDQAYLTEKAAHHLINERVARATEPHLHTGSRRHRMAERLHRLADRIEK